MILDSFNPYSNGSSFFIARVYKYARVYGGGFNPYSNGSSFFIFTFWIQYKAKNYVSILILMDLPFLSKKI